MSTPASYLPFVPAARPKTQGEWQQHTNVLQTWQQLLNALNGTVTSQGTNISTLQAALTVPTFTPVAYQNGWSDYGGGWGPVGYYTDWSQRVWLRGLAKAGTIGQVIFALPAPAYYVTVSTLGYGPTAGYQQVRFTIDPNGTIYTTNATADLQWVTLEGVSYSLLT